VQAAATDKFAVFAEVENHAQPLLMLDLSFAKLMDEVVLPYQTDAPFFVDGAPLKRKDLKRLKILRLKQDFVNDFEVLNMQLHAVHAAFAKMVGEQYHLRLEAILRDNGEDVTSQVISAFDKTIKPSLKDYLPKREELIQTALQFFLKNVSQLAGLNPAT
jgi:hypothetical protein